MSTDSVIHDIGYQRYTGRRLGRGYATRSLYVHGVRSVFGFGRPAKSKIFPWAMVAVMFVVAFIDIAIRSRTGALPLTYRPFCIQLFLPALLFLASTAPELLCRDLRHNVLPLYFSRPLSRTDYVWAKLAAAISGIWLLYAVPLSLIFGAGLFSLTDWTSRWHEFLDYASGLALAGIFAVVYAAIGLLFSSWLRRRMVAAAVIVGYFLVTTATGAVIGQLIGGPHGVAIGEMFSPPRMVIGLQDWLFRVPFTDVHDLGPVFAVVAVGLVAVCVALLHLRYRKVSA